MKQYRIMLFNIHISNRILDINYASMLYNDLSSLYGKDNVLLLEIGDD